MTVYNSWSADFYSPSTWTNIPNLVSVDLTVGRQVLTDQWPVSTGQLRFHYPNGFASPISNLAIDQPIRVIAPGRVRPFAAWTGRVSNIRVELGVPYQGTTGNADYLIIDVEGALSYWARSNTTFLSTFISRSLVSGIDAIAAEIGYPVYLIRGFGDYYSTTEIQFGAAPGNLQGNAAQILNQTVQSLNGRILDGVYDYRSSGAAPYPIMEIVSTSQLSPAAIVFSDTLNDATNRVMESVDLAGLGDTYYTKTTVTPASIAEQSAGSGYREYTVNTFNSRSSTAAELAAYLNDVLNDKEFGLSTITAVASAQNTQNLDTLGATYTFFGTTYDCQISQLPGVQIAANFRGTTYSGTIEGVQVSATTEDARFTYYISNLSNSDWFTLDSSYFGVLDQDRLAWT